MIEWLAIGAVAALGGLFGSGGTSSSRQRGSSGSFDQDRWQRERAAKKAEWRSRWEHGIDRALWIPQSAAHRIIAAHPPPGSEDDLLGSTKGLAKRELLAEFASHNQSHLAQQKIKLKAFFDSVEASPLTDEQADACICMDDAVQIVAAAGSGKTSTMVAKTGYVLHEKLAAPDEILLLAFNTKAANELQERVRTRLAGFQGAERVTVRTFHAFGKSVLAEVNGLTPAVARWVGSPAQEKEMIVTIVDDLRSRDPSFGVDWDMFRAVYGRAAGRIEDIVEPRKNGLGDIRTAGGEFVKSEEERLISDWLFFHGVRYEYERDYEHDTRTKVHQQYRPDFFYPDANLYHEHFALNREGRPPRHFTGDYLAGVAWKRACHAEHNTDLFETTSHSLRRGSGFDDLASALRARGVHPIFDAARPTQGRRPLETSELAGLMRAFQQHAKGGNLSVRTLLRQIEADDSSTDAARSLRFLALYERIAAEWERRLDDAGCIDFDDMLIQAASLIEEGRFDSRYTIIFADEFQDSSRARVRLLKALLDRTQHRGHLCVVGDDWQSINRFAGADLSVMTEFAQTFPHCSQLKLTTTFRCPEALCKASSAFISANPRQLEKVVQTTNQRQEIAMAAFACETSEDAIDRVHRHLCRLHDHAESGSLGYPAEQRVSVLLLGRYNHDRPKQFNDWQDRLKGRLDLTYRTIHSAKGLEADYVMILNMVEGDFGFPSQIADDPVLLLAMPEAEDYPMAEERRVFYVALTRARRQVRIYTKASSPSRFLVELAKAELLDIHIDGAGKLMPCPRCQGGILTERSGRYGPFEGCGSCDFTRNLMGGDVRRPSNRVHLETPMPPGELCPTCGSGRMKERSKARQKPFVGCSGYPDCKTTAPLLRPSR
ncbi:UvrD-helicase domain-containing protein [Pararhodobacter sp. SW119]|uniref:UvrD-helicase domain-containing protein n=1 Tax=Pararhodobacter sp. SW119 TaxID=2780075 RepID=UPI001ADEEFB6|nr:UvrD-helicase domain-containing protein [Pararhodobacter sp. SW119]